MSRRLWGHGRHVLKFVGKSLPLTVWKGAAGMIAVGGFGSAGETWWRRQRVLHAPQRRTATGVSGRSAAAWLASAWCCAFWRRQPGRWGDGESTACPACGGTRYHRWGGGADHGGQRWRCVACGRTFTARTGTPLAGLHSPEKLRYVVMDMLAAQPRSCRRLAGALDLDKSTIWAWRRKINQLLLEQCGDQPAPSAAAAADTVRESRKVSREWVRHRKDPGRVPAPDRRRWIDYRQHHLPLPRPMTPYLVPLMLVVDQRNRHRVLVGAQAGRCSAGAASRPVSVDDLLADSCLRGAFRRFIALFRGPATRHLECYAAWFTTRLGAGLEGQATATAVP
jgi:transposase-like protein